MNDSSSARTQTLRGIMLSVCAFTLWACGDALIKYLGPREPIYTLAFWTQVVIVGALLLAGLSPRTGSLRGAIFHPQAKWFLLRGVIVFAQFMTGLYALTHMDLARTYALFFTAPLLTTLLAFLFLGERQRPACWLSIVLGFAGVLCVLRPGAIPLSLATVLALLNALCFSSINLISRHVGRQPGHSAFGLLLVAEIVVLAGTVPPYIVHFTMPSALSLFCITIIGLAGVIGYLAMNRAFAIAPAAIVAPFHYIQMLLALLFGRFFFGETPDRFTAAGAAVIIASGLWLILQQTAAEDPLPETLIATAGER